MTILVYGRDLGRMDYGIRFREILRILAASRIQVTNTADRVVDT